MGRDLGDPGREDLIDVHLLFQLWTVDKLPISEIARLLDASESKVERWVQKLRRLEGEDRWPLRRGAIHPRRVPETPKRLKRGTSTLPPLASLDGTQG